MLILVIKDHFQIPVLVLILVGLVLVTQSLKVLNCANSMIPTHSHASAGESDGQTVNFNGKGYSFTFHAFEI